MAKMKQGPRGAGRPPDTFPEQYVGAAVAMTRDGKSVDDVREFLKGIGYNVSRRGINQAIIRAVHGDKPTLHELVQGDSARVKNELQGLQSVQFEDYREVVDDMIIDGRDAKRIRLYLVMEGFSVSLEDVISYVHQRYSLLQENDLDPLALSIERRRQGVRDMRRLRAEIWSNMPAEQRYTAKMWAEVTTKYFDLMQREIDDLKATQEPEEEDERSIDAELLNKLDLDPANDTDEDDELALVETNPVETNPSASS